MPALKYLVKPLFLLFAFSNLVIGVLAGLGRLGWNIPLSETYVHHGAIMVGGFLGSLIALEKVIPLKRPIFYIGPLLSASSILLFVTGQFQTALVVLIMSSAVFVLVYMTYLQKQYTLYLVLAMVGALCWSVGNVLLLWKRFYPMVFPWWMGFILFTIVSERLELSRFLPVTKRQRQTLIASLSLFLLGILLPFHGAGTYIAGASMALISIWLLRHDVVKLTIRKEGLMRFTAIALVCGYVTLLLVGIFLIVLMDVPLGYDIVVHTFFLGFAFSMIFAHGPIILPGVLGLAVKPYHLMFYVPLIGLLTSLAMRIVANVNLIPFYYRAVSGWISAGSILLYFLVIITCTLSTIRHAKSS